jgi:hypothetical protein
MFVALALLLASTPAEAHGIAGNRYFPVPLHRQGGHGVGVTAGLELFLQDLMPSLFERPALSSLNGQEASQTPKKFPPLRQICT